MGARVGGGRLRADGGHATLLLPVACLVRHPVAQHQCAVAQGIGQFVPGGCVPGVSPAEVHDFDGHTHRVHQRAGPVHIQRCGLGGRDGLAQAQGDLAFNATVGKRPVACIGRARPYTLGRQRRMGQFGIARGATGLPVHGHIHPVKPAHHITHAVLHGIGRFGRTDGGLQAGHRLVAATGGHQGGDGMLDFLVHGNSGVWLQSGPAVGPGRELLICRSDLQQTRISAIRTNGLDANGQALGAGL